MTQASVKHNRIVAVWLLGCCALVFAMVVLGGVTRLTGSGLSMVNWRPIMGVLPPVSESEWAETFALYRGSPEFRKLNDTMDVQQFKGIFWLEYLHRLLGRTIGIIFLVPFLFFSWRGYIRGHEWPKYLAMFVLGGMQGLLGWYMVKSGLVHDPHVSQYRLTAHLIAAFVIYAYMFWVAMSLVFRHLDDIRHRWYGRTVALTLLVTLTVISGGFVAGLKAGFVYNTFPLMGGQWIPPGLLTFEPAWRNIFENIVTVQFDHRVLAMMTFMMIITYWFFAPRDAYPQRARASVHLLLIVGSVQVILGISTLLLQVPLVLAAAHQATALLLFSVALYLCHALRGVRP